ncbi:cell surface protein [Methanosarcina horonobensis HB-1 = JCM 15518]|uniref:Cell surface protein n=1 Tax=Methanosarcina horonobensis HB-1 = JCM 15518 TaxID=1434110 RepID=A0A0E3S883_9EURY|nr:cell surface protein [Methanosarcina horonobensis HB-1 = JCM 15518]
MNIAGGPYLGGNFWVSPEGDGFSQTASDEDGDMIADLPFNITETNYDYLSLVFGKISEKTESTEGNSCNNTE